MGNEDFADAPETAEQPVATPSERFAAGLRRLLGNVPKKLKAVLAVITVIGSSSAAFLGVKDVATLLTNRTSLSYWYAANVQLPEVESRPGTATWALVIVNDGNQPLHDISIDFNVRYGRVLAHDDSCLGAGRLVGGGINDIGYSARLTSEPPGGRAMVGFLVSATAQPTNVAVAAEEVTGNNISKSRARFYGSNPQGNGPTGPCFPP